MMIRFIAIMILSCVAIMASPAMAQNKGDPIEITADKTLEWHRAESQYVADGNAMVKQGTTTIRADVMTADYREGKKSGADIYRLTGTGKVSIEDQGSTSSGDKIIYDIDSGLATMTGKSLSLTSAEQKVTATEKFEYMVKEGKLRAVGNAKILHAKDVLEADSVTAFLNDSKTLQKVDADGHVKITTPSEILTGMRATYNAKTHTAIITGGVTITRGQNVLNGERAEIDLQTNVSRLYGGSIEDGQFGGRVRGVFYPGEQP